MNIEILGIIASLIVLLSAAIRKILLIRVFNLIGSIVFCIYGVLIGAFSVWFLNGSMAIILSIQIVRLLVHSEDKMNKEQIVTEVQKLRKKFSKHHTPNVKLIPPFSTIADSVLYHILNGNDIGDCVEELSELLYFLQAHKTVKFFAFNRTASCNTISGIAISEFDSTVLTDWKNDFEYNNCLEDVDPNIDVKLLYSEVKQIIKVLKKYDKLEEAIRLCMLKEI